MDPREITALVENTVKESQSAMLNRLGDLMTAKLTNFQQEMYESQKALSEVQVAKIELISTDTYKFNKKGNEEQFKINGKIGQKIKEAGVAVKENANEHALEKIEEGMAMLERRQKLIKLADSSELGWRTVSEYETNAIADNSDDEKKMWKAESRAQRKFKLTRRTTYRSRRMHPYIPEVQQTMANSSDNTRTPRAQQTISRRPGTCFQCGKPGHWRYECQETQRRQEERNEKLSTKLILITDASLEDWANVNKGEFDTKPIVLTTVGRLREARDKWHEIGASESVLDIIDNGYKIPFFTLPEMVDLPNNKSARAHREFVEAEIGKLMEKGCISEVKEKPLVINPLTVADNKEKLRLVLDCRHVNPHLYKNKFKYEADEVAKDILKKGDKIFGFDLKSAYHHIEIFEQHRKYLGLAWEFDSGRRYFVFNVLPFGISTAGYIFTKVTRTLIKHWRSKGENIIMFLDDGIGGASEMGKAKAFSLEVQKDLQELGFLIAEEKCVWEPQSSLTWLGLRWDMTEGKVFITEKRIEKLQKNIDKILQKTTSQSMALVKEIAGVAGQIISMQTAVGKVVQLKTRELFNCINSRASWNAPVVVSAGVRSELKYWAQNIRSLNGIKLENIMECSYSVYTDASGEGYGGYVVEKENSDVVGSWSEREKEKSSTWRELEAVNRVLKSSDVSLEGQGVQWYTDNKNVVSIIQKGSKRADLQEKAIEIHEVCNRCHININPVWICRDRNKKADELSRCSDSDDWYIDYKMFKILDDQWGKHTIDRFSNDYNSHCEKFNSRWWCPGTSGVDAFKQNWASELNWWVPPPRLICKTINKIKKDKASGTLVIPLWQSAPFWPKVHCETGYLDFVKDFRVLDSEVSKKGRGNNGIFGNRKLKFKFMALCIKT